MNHAGHELTDVFDIAVVGSGFAGSLFAMIARRLGRSVLLVERGRHPRFAIGESSTPLANLLLHDVAREYDLPRLAPLTKWGSWQSVYPHLACGLKRGFTFYQHRPGESFAPLADRSNQLLVAASPHDLVGDTHWYRPDFDAFLASEAQDAGVRFVDGVNLDSAEWCGNDALLRGTREGAAIQFRARWVVDASGPRGFLHRVLGLAERAFPWMLGTQSLYGHFRDVKRLSGDAIGATGAPYPPEDAAVHHVFDGGWVWVLRFNNEVTSAGVAATDELAWRLKLNEGQPAWERLCRQFPTLGDLFGAAIPLRPLTYVPKLSFRTTRTCGPWWVLLPSAAGFIDPLLSTGFPLTLLGIARLARVLEHDWDSNQFAESVKAYARQTDDELNVAARLIGALYDVMGRFRTFTSLCMLYFAAASFSEVSHRLGIGRRPNSFLLHDHPTFGPALVRLCEQARLAGSGGSSCTQEAFDEEVCRTIDPINVAGLCDPERRNWYPAEPGNLAPAAAKLGTTPQVLRQVLAGFDAPQALTPRRQRR